MDKVKVSNGIVYLTMPKAEIENSKGQIPTGGRAGQVLVKQSDLDFDCKWEDPPTTEEQESSNGKN